MMINQENIKYKKLVEKMLERCQDIQTENERFVLRITSCKNMLRRQSRDVELLKRRLDRYNDNWRSVPMVPPNAKRKIEQKRGPKPKKPKDANDVTAAVVEKKVRKQRVSKKKPEAGEKAAAQPAQPNPEIVSANPLTQQMAFIQQAPTFNSN